ncbi:unnamed protein product, partial [Mesorhabditis belari]|uniref:RING-type E3 ubiquitin transferase n=1 Tax=Mesorhabditis belari TaxID=2138241 RepID=A0AAF3E856_9BILA
MNDTSSNEQGSSKQADDPNGSGFAPESSSNNETYDCNICLDTAKDPVITMCGHLFCWPCLVQWLDTRPNNQVCPVCKSGVQADKVIPLYGRGGNNVDPRTKVPPRPKGQRTEAQQGFPGFTFGDGGGVQFSLGIGVFPFGLFAQFFNGGGFDRRPDPPEPGSRQYQEERFLDNVFMYLGIFFILWLLLV